ncbi:MAG: hypothetical protein WC004_01305 [Candidatus Absconditabacterales bacterium]
MWQSVSRATIEDVVGTHIYKLTPKESPEHFVVPIKLALTMFSDQGIVSMGQLGCRNLQDIIDTLEIKSEKIASSAGRSKGGTIKNDLETLLLKPVGLCIDTQIGFDESKFIDSCEIQDINPAACHILMPLHVSEELRRTLDNNQAMYGIDNHVYLTRDYLIQYGAKRVHSVLSDPSIRDKVLQKAFKVPNRN